MRGHISRLKKIIIITPTFNRFDSLREAVDSVLNQTYQDWECYIVSDGYDSKVRKYIQSVNDRRIRYLFTLHTGYSGHLQRNVALKFAKGKYVFCLDDDNILNKDYIEKMVRNFDCDKVGYIVCYIKNDGRGVLKPKFPFRFDSIDMLNYVVKTDIAKIVGGRVPFNDCAADLVLGKTGFDKPDYLKGGQGR